MNASNVTGILNFIAPHLQNLDIKALRHFARGALKALKEAVEMSAGTQDDFLGQWIGFFLPLLGDE